ncbi:blue light receptor [Dinochytrium kinnereticum]|nr:blue light receptor [Dinochytrium kinnereticum]
MTAADDASEDSRNNATGSEDSIQTTKANLSRHVTSVITHFTATKDGYRRLVNELDDFLHVVSPQGSILYCSPSAKRHLGISAEDLEGQQLADFIHPDDKQLLIGHINISVVDHAEYSAFCRFRRTSGEYVLFEVRGKPFPSLRSEGEVRFVVQAGREYRSKGSLSVDSILELRIENLRLRKRLEESLISRGADPKAHPLLRAEITESAPSAHPYDLDVGGNLTTHISEEDFVGSQPPILDRQDEDGQGPSLFGSVVGGGGGGIGRRRSVEGLGTPDWSGGTGGFGTPTTGGKRVLADEGDSGGKPSRKRKNKVPVEELFCRQCGSTSSPEWRKGPLGPKTLCNACGLAYSKKLQKEKKRMQKMADADGGGGGGGDGKESGGKPSGGVGGGLGDESMNDD